jgi:hypothetical protein
VSIRITKLYPNEEKRMPMITENGPGDDVRANALRERLYTKDEVKAKKHTAGVAGLIVGALSTLAAGVIANKVARVNITNESTRLVDVGIEKIKKIKNKKNETDVAQ